MMLSRADWQIITNISKDHSACTTSTRSITSRKLWIYRPI